MEIRTDKEAVVLLEQLIDMALRGAGSQALPNVDKLRQVLKPLEEVSRETKEEKGEQEKEK